jgi:hypothetical protein
LSGNEDVEFLHSPAIVEIKSFPPEIIIDYAWIGLGAWKAQLKSTHGKSSQVFRLFYSGPEGDWLNGSTVGRSGKSEEIDFGHREGDFLAFTIKLSQPDGQHIETFFIGKMMGDKIVGTFVDDAGVKGEWNAIRVPDSPEKSDCRRLTQRQN